HALRHTAARGRLWFIELPDTREIWQSLRPGPETENEPHACKLVHTITVPPGAQPSNHFGTGRLFPHVNLAPHGIGPCPVHSRPYSGVAEPPTSTMSATQPSPRQEYCGATKKCIWSNTHVSTSIASGCGPQKFRSAAKSVT